MSGDRPRRVRAFARKLSDSAGAEFTAQHDVGAEWTLEWVDGPTPETVQAAADVADLGGARLRLRRYHSARAHALVAIRLAHAGKLPYQRGVAVRLIEDTLVDTEHPQRADDDRQQRMAQRLVDTVRRAGRIDTEEIAQVVGTKGLPWLIDDDTLTAVEILTARYATGDHLGSWRHQGRAMPAAAAVTAALADPEISPAAVEAVLELLPELRADLARIEQDAFAAARRLGVSVQAVANNEHEPGPGEPR